jgi:HK97 family phage portal protein
MQIGPFTIARTKSLALSGLNSRGGTWWPWVREAFTGAWQQNAEIKVDNVLTYAAVFACVTLIASDIAKLGLCLVERDADRIWNEVTPPAGNAWAPVLRKPNRYQNRIKFIEQWITSKLIFGNTYVFKERAHARGVVTALYVLDPQRVTPLVTPSGDVYYQLSRDDLSGLRPDGDIVPASEIIHDRMIAIFHPLIGVSPIFACGLAAQQGLAIQGNSNTFFANGSNPSGMLTAPGEISNETAIRLKAKFEAGAFSGANTGSVIVAGDGLKYEQFTMNAVDAQLIEQLKWSADTVCSTFHVPPYMVGIGPPPPYANIEPLLQQYYAQALQSLIENLELCLDEGLELPAPYGTQVDLDDLFRMDTLTKADAAGKAIVAGLAPDEVRFKYFDKGPVTGGASPMMQQQNYSLAALAKRDAGDPFAVTAPERITGPAPAPMDSNPADHQAAKTFAAAVRRKSQERWRRAA